MKRTRIYNAYTIGSWSLLGLATACADPCLDDGLQQSRDASCPVASGGSDGGTGTAPTTGADDAVDSGTAGSGTCDDGIQNGDETDVDCGGSCDTGCGSGQGCDNADDCVSGECGDDGMCTPPTCDDGVQNGDETDVDCGGSCDTDCDDGEGCSGGDDCISGMCDDDGTCTPGTCDDKIQNGDETDVDCGGPTCDACPDGDMCIEPGDCQSMDCRDKTCIPGTCRDMVMNGDETDVDCGGSCPACEDDRDCIDPTDCRSGVCEGGICIGRTCEDGVMNGDETDVDCGGSCPDDCDDGEGCTMDDDCISESCDRRMMICLPPSCMDGVQNGDETDLDCGGACGSTCEDGEMCLIGGDCISMLCDPMTQTCVPPACDDTTQNGDETDIDCGGSCGATCEDGEMCLIGGDCISLSCDPVGLVCLPPACDDMVHNGNETDLDCGGSCGATCEDGEMCLIGGDCISLSCDPVGLVCLPPACDDGVQNGDETDVDCGGACGSTCETGETCMIGGDCVDDVCLMDDTCAAPLTVTAAPACAEYDGVTAAPLTAVASGGTGAYTYDWAPPAGLDDPTSATPNASPTGVETYTVTADDGVNQAQDALTVVGAAPLDLQNNCTLYQGDIIANGPASVAYSAGGTVACELGNNDFGLHLCEGALFQDVTLSGGLTVTDDVGDNDMIGFVWGAQDNANFYSLTWKRQTQNFFGCSVPMGIMIKRIEAPNFGAITGPDLYCAPDTANSTLLLDPTQTQAVPAGWAEGIDYTVTIDYLTTGSTVSVTHEEGPMTVVDATFAVNDNTFPSGFFGSTTTSQNNACVGPMFASCL